MWLSVPLCLPTMKALDLLRCLAVRTHAEHSAEPVDGMAANAVDIEFPECTANWGTVKAFGLYDAVSGGHLLSWDALKTEQTIVAGNQVRFKPGTLKITFTKKAGSR